MRPERNLPRAFFAAVLLGLLLGPAAAQQAAEPRVKVSVAGAQVLGRADAPLTMVEYADYECGYCQQYHGSVFLQLKRDFIDTGKLRYVVRDFPLPMHRQAVPAARAARCAAEQGKFWEMREVLFKGDAPHPEAIAEAGARLGMDGARLRACATGTSQDAGIRSDIAAAQAAGVTATPTFVLGRSAGDQVEGVRFTGLAPYADFEARIRALLPKA